MNSPSIALVSVLAFIAGLTAASSLPAQTQTEARSAEHTGSGAVGGDENRPPRPPLDRVLDANGDGVIDADEISGAAKALLKLDQNGDGQLTEDEYRPARPEGQGRRRPPSGTPRSPQPPTGAGQD